jgi:hypothetical protein
MVGEIPDILTTSRRSDANGVLVPDDGSHSFASDGWDYRTSYVRIGDKDYQVVLNVGVNPNGKVLFTINQIKEASRSPLGESRTASGDASENIVANPTTKVNPNQTETAVDGATGNTIERTTMDDGTVQITETTPGGVSTTRIENPAAEEAVAVQAQRQAAKRGISKLEESIADDINRGIRGEPGAYDIISDPRTGETITGY